MSEGSPSTSKAVSERKKAVSKKSTGPLMRRICRRGNCGGEYCTIFPALVDAPEVNSLGDVAVGNIPTSRPSSSHVKAEVFRSHNLETNLDGTLLFPRRPSILATRGGARASRENWATQVTRLYPNDCNRFEDNLQLPNALSARTMQNGDPSQSIGRDLKWRVVLLKHTCANGQTVDQVAECLASVLCVDLAIAEDVAEKAWDGQDAVEVCTYKTQRDAMVIAQKLRDAGMVVRVMSTEPSRTPRGSVVKHFARRFSAGDEQCGILRLAERMQKQTVNPDAGRRHSCTGASITPSMFDSESTQASSTTEALPKLKSLVDKHKVQILKMRERKPSIILKNPNITGCSRILKGSSVKKACRLARTCIFGDVTDTAFTSQMEKDFALRMGLQEAIGTKDMVKVLHAFWSALDKHRNGIVALHEFRAFANASKRLLVEEIEELAALFFGIGERGLQLDDLMRVVWPSAGAAEIALMMGWCAEHDREMKRDWVDPPPLLPKSEYDGLRSVFAAVAGSPEHKVAFQYLVKEGLLHDYQIDDFRRLCDQNKNGLLSFEDFCALTCPAGFRADEHAKTGRISDGRAVFLDELSNQWFVEREASDLLSSNW